MAIGRALGGGEQGIVSTLFIAVPSGVAVGDAVAISAGLKGFALTDRDANGNATIAIKPSQVFRMTVVASDDVDSSPLANPSDVALGDSLYVEANSEVISKDSDDLLFGYALGTRDANGAYTAAAAAVAGADYSGECDILLA